jgi:hypothetical protein
MWQSVRSTAAIVGLSVLVGGGCVASRGDVGVSNQWRADLGRFEDGVSTQDNVLEFLGPPSQLIPLEGRVVYYYVLERSEGRDLYLILYNRRRDEVFYDRAIFFFDEKGVLERHSYSTEEIPFEPAGTEE